LPEGEGGTPADALAPGDVLRTRTETAVVAAVHLPSGRTTVYNLSVEGSPNYFVGTDGVWVHNCVRWNIGDKIAAQMGTRGWTPQMIDEAIAGQNTVRAVNRANNNPATRYIHPTTGQSVVIDDVTNDVIHVGGPGFRYGPDSGDLP